MISFQWPFKLKKRQIQSNLGYDNGWRPYAPLGTNFPPSQAGRLSAVYKCIKLYESVLKCAVLKVKEQKSHYLLDLIKKPNSFIDKNNLWSILTYEYFMNGVFRSRVIYDNTGKVLKIFPYRARSIYGYAREGQYGDAESIDRSGHYYRDFKGRILMPDEIWELRDDSFSQWDFLNPLGRVVLFALSFNQSFSILNYQKLLSDSGLRGPSLLVGMEDDSPEALEKVKKSTEKFISLGAESTGRILTMPSGYQIKSLMVENGHLMTQILSSFSDLTLSRVFNCPIELVGRSDGKTEASGQGLKSVIRLWLNTSVKDFLKVVATGLESLAGDGTQFFFDTNYLYGDMREQALFAKALVDAGVLSPEKASGLILGDMDK